MSIKPLRHIEFHRIRPRIHYQASCSSRDLTSLFSSKLKEKKNILDGQIVEGFTTIYPAQSEQHYWSPQLTLTIEDNDNGSLIRGLYGPKPTVWTMFIFFYAGIGFATLMITLVGLSLLSLGKGVGILWFVPLLLLLFASLYITAYLGQKFGHKQMVHLHHFLEECLGVELETV